MNWRLRLIVALLLALLAMLQYRLWVGPGSMAEVKQLNDKIAQQEELLKSMRLRNDQLKAEIQDLKDGLSAVEARARSDLGMIKQGETFYQVLPPAEEAPKP